MGEKALTLGDRVEGLVQRYEAVSGIRDRRLFTHFLTKGYRQTTLSSVSTGDLENVIFAKVCLGMIITLYDDLADNPRHFNPGLLKVLYQLNVDETPPSFPVLKREELPFFDLACGLFSQLRSTLSSFPRQQELMRVLAFDIRQVFLANQYSELMGAFSGARNMTESRFYGPYNMGMVAAGMIDLMASPFFDRSELGRLREFLLLGQRLGRIGNLISTYERELGEGDLTNEIMLSPLEPREYMKNLTREFYEGLSFLMKSKDEMKGVDLSSYAQGLASLYHLHLSMTGTI